MSLAGSSEPGRRLDLRREAEEEAASGSFSLPASADRKKGVQLNLDTLETISDPNGSEADENGFEDLEETWREMRRVVDEIDRNYSLGEIPEDDWEIYVEYCAALGEPVSERDLLRRKHPELYPEEIDFMLSPPKDGDCPF
jgi:hypothetical protein